MEAAHPSLSRIRFGPFELEVPAGELRRSGVRIRLQDQPVRILLMLLERAGQLVSREELRQKLWPDGTFVDFEHSLNTAVKKLRAALCDDAESPRYIETVPRRGYRFVGQAQLFRAIDSLAILPFENAGGDPELEYFTDGITEALIRNLAQLPGLRVMARSTMFCFKGRSCDPRAVGCELQVGAVLVGRVLQHGDRLLVGIELVETATGLQLWSDQYNRAARDIFSVQEDISREISVRLRLRLTAEAESRLKRRHTESTEAYHLYLKGRHFWHKFTDDAFRKAIQSFNQAVEIEPLYALAYVGLAECYGALGFYGYLAPAEAWPKAKAAATKALQIDESLAEAHATLAVANLFYDWDWNSAKRESRRAIELNPSYPPGYQYYSFFLLAMGRPEEAVAELQRTREFDPLSPVADYFTGVALYFSRRYDEATEQFRRILEFEPHFAEARRLLGVVYVQAGMPDKAIPELEEAAAALGSTPAGLGSLGRAYARAGQRAQAEEVLRRLERLAKEKCAGFVYVAHVYIGLGENDRAFQWAEKAFEERSSWLAWLNAEPWWDPLRADPRFQALVERVGLPS